MNRKDPLRDNGRVSNPRTEEDQRAYRTLKPWPGSSETGIIDEVGSLQARFEHLDDPRKARGKRDRLVTWLGKLGGQDSPVEIAAWAANHAEKLVARLGLERLWRPPHNPVRRGSQAILSEAEFKQMAQEDRQPEQGGKRAVLALAGKPLRGTGIRGHQKKDPVLRL